MIDWDTALQRQILLTRAEATCQKEWDHDQARPADYEASRTYAEKALELYRERLPVAMQQMMAEIADRLERQGIPDPFDQAAYLRANDPDGLVEW